MYQNFKNELISIFN